MTPTTDRYDRGVATQAAFDPELTAGVHALLDPVAPDFATMVVSAFGDVYARPGLDARARTLTTIVALAVTGQHGPLETYLRLAPGVGLTREECVEALIQLHLYAGVPTALAALGTARRAFA